MVTPQAGAEAPASAPSAEGATQPQGTQDQQQTLEQRLQNQSRIIAGLQKKLESLESKEAGAASAPSSGNKFTAVEEMVKKAEEREERAKARTIRAAIEAAALEAGIGPALAKKLLPEVVKELKPAVNDDDEVICEIEPGVLRNPKDALHVLLSRDDWRDAMQHKAAPRAPGGKPAPVRPSGVLPQPNEFGVYKASELRASG